jgi:membrane protein implicated in regulation of membrane protease activity
MDIQENSIVNAVRTPKQIMYLTNFIFLVLATALLIILTVFQVILFFMGVKYLNDCPRQPNLPVYLLVVGSMGLVRVLNLLWKQFRRRRMRKLEGIELDQEEEPENGLYAIRFSS